MGMYDGWTHHLKQSQLWVIINKSIINAFSCCHITYSMFWQNIPINRFHSNKHKDTFEFASLPFCSKCQHIFQVICTCFVGFNSEQGREPRNRERERASSLPVAWWADDSEGAESHRSRGRFPQLLVAYVTLDTKLCSRFYNGKSCACLLRQSGGTAARQVTCTVCQVPTHSDRTTEQRDKNIWGAAGVISPWSRGPDLLNRSGCIRPSDGDITCKGIC